MERIEKNDQKHHLSSQFLIRKYFNVSIIFLIGTILAIVSFAVSLNIESSQLKNQFLYAAGKDFNYLKRDLESFSEEIKIVHFFVKQMDKHISSAQLNELNQYLKKNKLFENFFLDYSGAQKNLPFSLESLKKTIDVNKAHVPRLEYSFSKKDNLLLVLIIPIEKNKNEVIHMISIAAIDDLSRNNISDSNFFIFDIGKINDRKFIYTSVETVENQIFTKNDKIDAESLVKLSPYYFTSELELFDKKWQVYFLPTIEYITGFVGLRSWFIFLFIMLITTAAGSLFYYLIGKNIKLERVNLELAQKRRDLTLRAKELEVSNKELDDFAYIASHDLKEPIRGIAGSAALLQEECKEIIDEKVHKRLSVIILLCEKMAKLINDLLYYSRLGRVKLAYQSVDPQELVKEIEETIRLSSQANDLCISISSVMPRITCDKYRITEVFRNLIDNAIKHNDKEAKRIEVGYIEQVEYEGHIERKVFYVKDNGKGIAPNFYQKIFNFSEQLERDPRSISSGIGLALVKKIVERHGGKIWLTSEVGIGSTFYFSLPNSSI